MSQKKKCPPNRVNSTLTLRTETFQAICLDYVASMSRHGFRDIFLVPSHGGNFQPLADALDDLRAAVGPATRVHAYTDLEGFVRMWRDAVGEVDSRLSHRVGGHADIAESSEMLCIRPDLVRADLAVEGTVGGFDGAMAERVFRDGFRAVTPNGILGDARGLSREIGERCLAKVADGIVAALREGRN